MEPDVNKEPILVYSAVATYSFPSWGHGLHYFILRRYLLPNMREPGMPFGWNLRRIIVVLHVFGDSVNH